MTHSAERTLTTSFVAVLGFIPKRQNYFACSYSETCRKALSEFYQDECVKIQRQSTDLPAVGKYNSQQFEVTISITHLFWLYHSLSHSIAHTRIDMAPPNRSTLNYL